MRFARNPAIGQRYEERRLSAGRLPDLRSAEGRAERAMPAG